MTTQLLRHSGRTPVLADHATQPRVTRPHRGLRHDPRVALSLTPVDHPFQPVIVRGKVVEWLDGDAAWEIVDRISTKYSGGPYSRHEDRVDALIEPDRQSLG